MIIYEIVGGVVFMLLLLLGALWLNEHVRLKREKDDNNGQS